MSQSAVAAPTNSARYSLLDRFHAVRALSRAWSALLSAEDQMVQSCPQASPVKWHLAHTTWFFDTFLLKEFLPDYKPFDPDFLWLFNSYYKSLGEHPEKSLRASFSRPSLGQVLDYRASVEHGIGQLLSSLDALPASTAQEIAQRMEIGFHHEQQHQELIATDIKHAFFTNPLHPALRPFAGVPRPTHTPTQAWLSFPAGLTTIGHNTTHSDHFAFDNECPQHLEYVAEFQLFSDLITCRDYRMFLEDGGYAKSNLWLSDGWDTVEREGWQAPLYWRRSGKNADGDWEIFTLHGFIPLENMLDSPVCHLSYYEAEAFAHWAGNRLPTEAEWETAALATRTSDPHFLTPESLDTAFLHPVAHASLLGSAWQWTQSAYLPYPGYRPLPGALGEYNGKFMSGQMVLRGGSVATPDGHMRPTYRNFFHPETRWQFSGIRLARAQAGRTLQP
jgi:ergothioneine biosynthesis protein EgtB